MQRFKNHWGIATGTGRSARYPWACASELCTARGRPHDCNMSAIPRNGAVAERIVAAGVLGQLDAEIEAQLDGVVQADEKIAAVLAPAIAAGPVSFFRPTDILCHVGRCRTFAGSKPYAADNGHLTDDGALDSVTRIRALYPAVWAAAAPCGAGRRR